MTLLSRPVRALRAPLAVLSALAVVAAGLVAAAPAQGATGDLFFSEYVEGSASNKAIEIFNGTGSPVDLSAYRLELYSNGAAAPSQGLTLSGTLADGDVYVVANPNAGPAVLAVADARSAVANWNGNDAVALRKGGAVVDVLGQIGTDPGTAWGSGATSTLDHTLQRKSSVLAGDTDPTDPFDPAAQWNGLQVDTFTGLGSHTVDGGTPTDAAPTVTSTPADGATGVNRDADVTVSFSEPVTATGAAYSLACTVSGAHPVSVTSTPTRATLDPTADFAFGDSCTVTVQADQVSDVDAVDPPDHPAADFHATFAVVATDPCLDPFTHTYAVQGSGTASPLAGQSVTTQGVVTTDFQGGAKLSGFGLEDQAGDGDPTTSDGVFVFGSATPDVSVGDVVRLTGRVSEFRNQTEVTYTVGSLVRCGSATPPAPTVVHLPESVNGELERYEGMNVRIAETLTVQQNFFLGRFGQLTLASGGRRSQPTNLFTAGSPQAQALADENARSLIVLDDATTPQNPIPTPYLDADNTRRAGDTVTGVTGMLDEGPINTSTTTNFDYRIEPTTAPQFQGANPRTPAPAPVGGNLKVGFFNVLNYFTTLVPDNSLARGADTAAEFTRQRTKIFAAMSKIDADVFGLSEIENLPGTDAVQDLVDGLNDYVGDPGRYVAVPDPTTGTGSDAIKVAMIYKAGAVAPVGASISDPDPVNNRPPLAQEFRLKANDETVNIVVNHLKSKSSCPAPGTDPGNEDSGDGQGCWNALRVQQAQRLLQFMDQVKTTSGDPDVLAIGDFNSYGHEDPIEALTAAGLVNEIDKHVGTEAYSFIFDGLSGYLDHGLATPSVDAQVADAEEWHINADEPSVIDYNTEFKTGNDLYTPTPYRSSDHDPVVIGLDLGRCQFSDDERHHVRTLLGDCTTSETVRVPNGWTLDGAGHSITAYDPRGGHFRGAVVANAGAVANVHDLTVRTRALADVCDDGNDRLRGILLDGASGVLHDNKVLGLAQAGSGCQEGNAIEVRNEPFGPGGRDVLVAVTANEVRGYQKGGIVLNGSVSGVVLGNTVQGLGKVPYIAQNGVQVAFAATALVESNTVTDNFYTGTADAESCGVLFFQADKDSKEHHTTFRGNQRNVCTVKAPKVKG